MDGAESHPLTRSNPDLRDDGSVMSAPATTSFWDQSAVQWFLGVPLRIAITVVVAIVVRWILIRIIRRVVRKAAAVARRERLGVAKRVARTTELTEILMGDRREQRAESVGQLLSSIVTFTIWTIAIIVILTTLGVDLGPVLASAGLIGVVVGFGAQTLIKDYISGVFLILEDQFGIGDVVDLGPAVGTIEEVTLRVTRLRDMSGVVWYVRNGEILRVANRSQGWTLSIVDVPVAYDENIDHIRELVERLAEDMDDDPSYDEILLGKPQFAGVESVSGDAVFVRITAKSAPEQQQALAREIRERVKTVFDRAGVRVPVLARSNMSAYGHTATGGPPPGSGNAPRV